MKRRDRSKKSIRLQVLGLTGPGVIVAFVTAALLRPVLSTAEADPVDTHEEVVAVTEELAPGHPVTVIFPLSKLLSCDQFQLQALPVQLVIEGVKIISGESTGIRVFVNSPGANADTPIKDLHYAASVAFFPSGPAEQASTYVIELRESLKALAATGQLANCDRLTITLVAIPAQSTLKELPVRIQIQSLTIKLE